MLRIYPTILSVVRTAGEVAKRIAGHDRDLARQLRRAASSVALNAAEASGVRGGSRRQRHATALGSAMEVRACFDVAVALGYITTIDAKATDELDHVVATLFKLTR